jgi:hypothetical protein
VDFLWKGSKSLTDHAYSWRPAYTATTLETDSATLCDRIKEALVAVQQRLSVVEVGSQEYQALEDAMNALGTLNAERADGAV